LIILPCMHWSSKSSLSFGFSNLNFYVYGSFFFYPCIYTPRPCYFSRLNYPNQQTVNDLVLQMSLPLSYMISSQVHVIHRHTESVFSPQCYTYTARCVETSVHLDSERRGVRKWREAGYHWILRSSVTWTLYQILLGWWSEGGWDGWGM
jgi:hypothetical protein